MKMTTRLIGVLVLVASSAGLASAEELLKSGPQVGQALPGPVLAFSVTGNGPWVGKFHCPICENNFNPGVLVFTRESGAADGPFGKLLTALDALADENPDFTRGICVVIMDDGGYLQAVQTKIDENVKTMDLPLTKAIIAKDDKVAQLKALAEALKLKHVQLNLGTNDGPDQYALSRDAQTTVIGYYRFKVMTNDAYKKDQLTNAEVENILKHIKTFAPPTEKHAKRKS
jgi:hypothetical protein